MIAYGATWTEILMGLRWEARALLAARKDLPQPTKALAESLVLSINDVLE